jgi:hypothetical protein
VTLTVPIEIEAALGVIDEIQIIDDLQLAPQAAIISRAPRDPLIPFLLLGLLSLVVTVAAAAILAF